VTLLYYKTFIFQIDLEELSSKNQKVKNKKNKSTKISSSITVFNIANNPKCFLSIKSDHIRMTSEGSCDTEDWSNDENAALVTGTNYISKYFTIENRYFLKL